MSEKIVQLNEEIIKGQIRELVRGSVEEALIEMYLAGVSVRRVEDITEALWGSRVSPATISELNKKDCVHRGFGCHRGDEGGQGQLGQLLPAAPWTRLGRREARRRRQVPGDCRRLWVRCFRMPNTSAARCIPTAMVSPLSPDPRSKL